MDIFFFSFFKKWVRSVYSGKKIFYGLKKRLKVLIFFFFYPNVKKNKIKVACMEAGERYS